MVVFRLEILCIYLYGVGVLEGLVSYRIRTRRNGVDILVLKMSLIKKRLFAVFGKKRSNKWAVKQLKEMARLRGKLIVM